MDVIKYCVKTLENFESNPGYTRDGQENVSNDRTLNTLKKCFELMVSRDNKQSNENTQGTRLTELFIDGFDIEQIWQQIELRNREIPSYIPQITEMLMSDDVHFPFLAAREDVGHLTEQDKPNIDNPLEDQESDRNDEMDQSEGDDLEDESSISSETDEEELNTKPEVPTKVRSKDSKNRESIVDDDFFRISEMEKFLDEAEKEEFINDDIDYFEDIPSDSDSSVNNAKYDDFFRNPDSENENKEMEEGEDEDEQCNISVNDDRVIKNGLRKKVKFAMSEDSDNDSYESADEEKTTFEKRESKLRDKIKKLEESNLGEKPWQYKGEVKLSDRPMNSLLEEVLDVDLSVRPPPIITENVTDTLEQIILNRIKDSAYDDVERKIKPVHVPHELKKELVLNQEKSKYSLAEIYEQEYLKRKPTEEKEEETDKLAPEKEKILKKMKLVFHKLDVLSNFHYTPKPISADVEVVNNTPAITIEEVTPVAMSDANLLAPQEVGEEAKKKLLGKDERTKSDKRRERRKKKAFMSQKFKKAKNTEGTKISQVLKSRNVEVMKSKDSTNVKSSTSFFNKLQEKSEVGKFVKIKKKKNSS